MTFGKILCPIDFSPGSRTAMRVAVRIANRGDRELVLAHAWYLPPAAFAGEYVFPPTITEQMLTDVQHGLDVTLRDAVSLGAKRVSGMLLQGVPWHELVTLLENDPEFGLVVMGTQGRTGLERVLMGSVAEQVVRHAPCSVMAVHPGHEDRPFTHALCPIDFSDSSRHAFDLAAALVEPGGKGITLLRVLELPVTYSGESPRADLVGELDRRSGSQLAAWADELRGRCTVPVTTRSQVGRPGAQILAVLADDPTFDLVAMGSHGRTGIKRLLLGSVTEKVVRHARRPVLVARRRDRG